MTNRTDEIFSELKQICEQYKAEVPSHRRAWPESVKARVFELRELGIKYPAIAERSGLCYQTIHSWRPRGQSFLPVKIKQPDEKSLTVTVRESKASAAPKIKRGRPRKVLALMTVTTPSGVRIEGVDSQTLAQLLEKLR